MNGRPLAPGPVDEGRPGANPERQERERCKNALEKDLRILAARSHSLSRVAGQKSSRAMRDVVDSLCNGFGRLSVDVALRPDLVDAMLALDFLLSQDGSREDRRCMAREGRPLGDGGTGPLYQAVARWDVVGSGVVHEAAGALHLTNAGRHRHRLVVGSGLESRLRCEGDSRRKAFEG
jgi:hypothetical protein